MEFRPASERRFETRVDILPSSPDGYFHIGDDPFLPPYPVSFIALRDVKSRHVRAVRRGDTSAMDRYIVRNAEQPGSISFTKCMPGAPDPLQPVDAFIYVKTTREVYLDRASQIDDAHSAIGQWWAARLLNPVLDNGDGKIAAPALPDHMRADLEQRARDFALILAHFSRSGNTHHISVNYQPDDTLRDAASMAFVPAPISLKSYTEITNDGVVMAKEGGRGKVVQIWPPAPDTASAGV